MESDYLQSQTKFSQTLPSPLTVLAINLEADIDRMNNLRNEFEKLDNFKLLRLPGIDASMLPESVLMKLTHRPVKRPGNIGCLLSHIKAWETVAKSDSYVLILEDDARIVNPHLFANLEIPGDADLVFVNSRNQPLSRIPKDSSLPAFLPIIELIHHYATPFNAIRPAIGGDGYLLSPNGAKRLMKAISKDTLTIQQPDWLLLRYSLKPEQLKGKLENTWWEKFRPLNTSWNFPNLSWDIITSYCLVPSFVDVDLTVNSSRQRLNQELSSE